MKNPIIIQAIRDMIPQHSIHEYFPVKEDAQREAYRSGRPWFVSVVGGHILYSVRNKA